ncbi:hypothetical protein [Streptomyces parvulus]
MIMEYTRMGSPAQETGEPLTDAEQEQARYALAELAGSERGQDGMRVSAEQLDAARPFFELGWAMGVRNGHTGPALAGVPIDQDTVDRAFVALLSERVARGLRPGPALWQRVDYHGSLVTRHGRYWVGAIHTHGDPVSMLPTLRYDLYARRAGTLVEVVANVRRSSITPLGQSLRAL